MTNRLRAWNRGIVVGGGPGDTVPPAKPTVVGIVTDTGISAADRITNDQQLAFYGTAEANSTVEVFLGGVSLGNVPADGLGNWTFNHTAVTLIPGDYTLQCTARDLAGNTSVPSDIVGFTINITQPTCVVSSTDAPNNGFFGANPINFDIDFSKNVFQFIITDITVANGTVTTFAGTGNHYDIQVTSAAPYIPTSVSIPAGVATDVPGNLNTVSNSYSITFDPNPYIALPNNHWTQQASASRLSDPGINPDPAVSPGSPLSPTDWLTVRANTGQSSIMNTWSGAAYDFVDKRIWLVGGGHLDYRGNEADYYQVGSETYGRLTWPSFPVTLGGAPADFQNPDGTPIARHTRSSLCVAGNNLYISGDACGDNASSIPGIWYIPIRGAPAVWVKTPTPIHPNGGGYTQDNAFVVVYDPNRDLVWAINQYGVYTLNNANPAAGWTNRVNNAFQGSYAWNSPPDMTGTYDVSRNRIVVFGRNDSAVFDCNNLANVYQIGSDGFNGASPTWTGNGVAGWISNKVGPGMAYDSVRNDIVGWNGGSTVYFINATAMTITVNTAPTGITPPAMLGTGIYSRLVFTLQYDVFVALNEFSEPAWIYRR